MQTRKIVITGGPGTGKSSVVEALEARGFTCFPEISREVILEAKEKGIEQLFLHDPLLFSQMLLDGRIEQFQKAKKLASAQVFMDRGIPDVVSYLHYQGTAFPEHFQKACEKHQYGQVFILPPWKEIYTSDNERYENFEQAVEIHKALYKTYSDLGYKPVEVPKLPVSERVDFILKNLQD